MHPLQKIVAGFLRSAVASQDEVAVACSGGADSMCLAHIAVRLAQLGRIGPVTLLHVDHQLHPDSPTHEGLVRGQAELWGVEFDSARVDVDRERASLEAAAREARYQALDTMSRRRGISWLLVAHTASDQAETVVMRILRGTGVAGLQAIPPRRGRLLRPLIGQQRDVIANYVREFDLPIAHDPSNASPNFLRNRVRHQHLPALRSENPQIDRALERLATAAREQREVLDFAARQLLPPLGRPVLASSLRAAPPAVIKRVMAMMATDAGLEDISARHLEAMRELVCRPEAGSSVIALPGGRLVREYDQLEVVSGQHADAMDSREALSVGPGYVVRAWQPGDKMRPARLRGRSRKLSDLFADLKVPRRLRTEARVVERADDGEIVWAEHVGRAHGSDPELGLTQPTGQALGKNEA